jgi:hypothetical protein
MAGAAFYIVGLTLFWTIRGLVLLIAWTLRRIERQAVL